MAEPQALVFDVGNVLIGVDFGLAAKSWGEATGVSPALLLSRFVLGPAYEAHERGEMDWSSYGEAICEALHLDLSREALLTGWNAIFTGPMPGIETLLKELPTTLPRYAFSNTNAVHQDYFMTHWAHLFDGFQAVFCSHEMGMRKPEAGSFTHVVTTIGVPARAVVFFDDSVTNVDAARRAGWSAYRSTSTGELRAGLQAACVL